MLRVGIHIENYIVIKNIEGDELYLTKYINNVPGGQLLWVR